MAIFKVAIVKATRSGIYGKGLAVIDVEASDMTAAYRAVADCLPLDSAKPRWYVRRWQGLRVGFGSAHECDTRGAIVYPSLSAFKNEAN